MGHEESHRHDWVSKVRMLSGAIARSAWHRLRPQQRADAGAIHGNIDIPFPSLFGNQALAAVLEHCNFDTVLDVGSGAGKHADIFEEHGKQVTAIDFGRSVYFQERNHNRTQILADYYTHEFQSQFDLIWASHVLEHQPNPNLFLRKAHHDLKDDGWLAISVPPLKHEIVGGHVTLWNAGLLLYNLVVAGFNCKNAWVRSYGYNISVILRKEPIVELPELHYDSGDVDRLVDYFPDELGEGFNGNIAELNWPMRCADNEH